MVKLLKALIVATAISGIGFAAQAGGLSAPIKEDPVAAPTILVDPPRGSVNGGYILLGAFVLMALAASAGP